MASEWVSCGFRRCLSDEVSRGLWDIILQSGDPSLSVFVGLVLILNARDHILESSNVPKLDEISLDDLDDLIQEWLFHDLFHMLLNPSVSDSLICVGSRFGQIGAFRSLRRDCTRLRHRRISWIVSKGRTAGFPS